MGARDLDPGGDHVRRRLRKSERRERVEHRSVERGLTEQADRGLEAGAGDRRAATRLAIAVEGALSIETQAEPVCGRVEHLVAREDELRPALDDAAGERRRPDSAADAIARLQHDDVDALPAERVGGRQAGKAGADHDDSHERTLTDLRGKLPHCVAQRPDG